MRVMAVDQVLWFVLELDIILVLFYIVQSRLCFYCLSRYGESVWRDGRRWRGVVGVSVFLIIDEWDGWLFFVDCSLLVCVFCRVVVIVRGVGLWRCGYRVGLVIWG